MEKVPSAYLEGYEEARLYDPAAADNYIRHTLIGDPELDPVMEELSTLPTAEIHRLVRGAVEQQEDVMARAPKILCDFMESVREPPSWVDFKAFRPGIRAFHANMSNMLIAYAVGSAVEGFSTLVSKSFSITGRVTGMGNGGQRRLRQNNRHMVEIYYPGGLDRDGDGWKVSMRIRFIHARVRRLMAESEAWNHEAWGTPLSAAHIGGISLFTFSIRQFEHATSMGAIVTPDQKESIVAIWRYVGHILGVPESILYTDEDEARNLYKVAHMCEPPPDEDSLAVANTVFKVIPVMAGVKTEAEQKSLSKYAYRLSRALIGNQLAEKFKYPRTFRIRWIVLLYYRLRDRLIRLLTPEAAQRQGAFDQIFDATQYDEEGISYRMPDHVRATQSSPW